jgi:hypothetical protein
VIDAPDLKGQEDGIVREVGLAGGNPCVLGIIPPDVGPARSGNDGHDQGQGVEGVA